MQEACRTRAIACPRILGTKPRAGHRMHVFLHPFSTVALSNCRTLTFVARSLSQRSPPCRLWWNTLAAQSSVRPGGFTCWVVTSPEFDSGLRFQEAVMSALTGPERIDGPALHVLTGAHSGRHDLNRKSNVDEPTRSSFANGIHNSGFD